MIHEVTAALQGCKDAVERGDVMTRLPARVRDIVNRNSPHFIDDAWEIFVGDVYRFIADGWRERAEWSNGELFGCRNGLLWLTCGWPVLALGHDAAAIGAEYGARLIPRRECQPVVPDVLRAPPPGLLWAQPLAPLPTIPRHDGPAWLWRP